MKKLIYSLAALLIIGCLGALAQTLPLYTVPLDPANLQAHFNSTINRINSQPYAEVMLQSSPLTGATQTLVGVQSVDVNLTPAGTIAADTVVFSTTPQNGQIVDIFSSQTITALTLTVTPGSIVGGVTTLAANGSVRYKYQSSNTTWYRVR